MDLLLIALGLGLAGIDVFGVFVVIAALSAGSTKRSVLGFVVTVFIGTVLLGAGLSLLLGAGVQRIATTIEQLPDYIWGSIDLTIATLLFIWAGRRIVAHRAKPMAKKKESGFQKWLQYGLFFVGIVFAVSALTDPSYVALIALAGHNGHLPTIIGAHTLWIAVSQAPLFIFAAAVLLNRHKKMVAWFQSVQRRYARQLSFLLTGVIIATGAVFLADLVTYLAAGEWLFG